MGRPLPARLLLTGTRTQRGNVWNFPDSAELLEAATWIRSHSKPARDITHEDLVRLRAFMGGTAYRTRRSNSAHIEKVIHWGIISGYLEEGFLAGLPSIARKLDAERIDPERVPNERQVWAIANAGGELEGEWFKVAVLLGTFGAMRIGELVALRRRRHPLRGARRAVAHHRQSDPEVSEAILGRWQDRDGFRPSKGKTDRINGTPALLRSQAGRIGDPGIRGQPIARSAPLSELLRPTDEHDVLSRGVEPSHQDPAGRSAVCRHHPTCHAPRGDVDVATARTGSQAHPELGGMAFALRDARHLRGHVARG